MSSNDPNYSLFDSTFVERVLNKKDVKILSEVVINPPLAEAEPPAAAISEPTRIFSPAEQEFARDYPAEWQWIQNSSFGFADAMRLALRRWGHLTDNQMRAVRNCIAHDRRLRQNNQGVIGEIPF